jgi:hypothetical protein
VINVTEGRVWGRNIDLDLDNLKSPAKTVKEPEGEQELPPCPSCRKAPDGNWYAPDPNRPGKYIKY